MSFVITIGREYGSGGRYIASELAKKLNVNFYDGKLLEKVAEKAGFSLDYVQSNDEKKDNYFFGYNMFSTEGLSRILRNRILYFFFKKRKIINIPIRI